ncbi:acyl carrier protein [Thermodesulfomicrobium sp. WS]|uniref:acyl carrier protein n=1 Tax=Thermodesulfomicrobium sp. WS TaxID=3004129 RepID=UPI0024902EFC|nr:acyl carrier protein [Thermodesulfomicrobium sp. WS]BDV01303.1 acyl carrier protein [Thermodesulfomicrobium sp. WS]
MTDEIIRIIADIMDQDPHTITPATYLVRDLGAQSIDLLEIGVAMQQRLGIPVQDDTLFLRDLRLVLLRAADEKTAPEAALAQRYPHLSPARISAILADLDAGPVLQVADLVAYAVHVRS